MLMQPVAALRLRKAGTAALATLGQMRIGLLTRDATLAATALAALGAGVLVYLADRDGGQAWLLPRVVSLAGRHWFGPAGAWLPSALHAFALALLSAVVLPRTGPARLRACAAWAVIDIGFELGQHAGVAPRLAAWLDAAGPAWLAGPPARYFERGTFDPADVAGVVLGASSAAALLWLARPRQENVDVS